MMRNRQRSNNAICIVNDDTNHQRLIEKVLEKNIHGNLRQYFLGSNQLMEHLQTLKFNDYPSLIILAMNAPVKENGDVVMAIKKNPYFKLIPLVNFTSSHSLHSRELYKLGSNCVVQKPSTYPETFQVLHALSNIYSLNLVFPSS